MIDVTNLLSNFSAWAISVAAVVTALSTVCKPIRKGVGWLIKKLFGNNSSDAIINEVKGVETKLVEKIDAISEKCDSNERDRLQQIIFTFGNYARKKQVISGEEYRYLQRCFSKYTKLGGNDIAHTEYQYIEDYYNNQKWNNE